MGLVGRGSRACDPLKVPGPPEAEGGSGVGRAFKVIVLATVVGVPHADVDGRALSFGDEEEKSLCEVVVAPLLVRLYSERNQAFNPFAGVGHGLREGRRGRPQLVRH